MSMPQRFDRIAFVASAGVEAQEALAQLVGLYGNRDPADADVVVALGGDGLMLQTLHQHMRSGKPIYGMHRGTIGFLMNEFSAHDLHARLAAAAVPIIRGPALEPWGLTEMWIQDPDGIQIVQAEVPPITLSAGTRDRRHRQACRRRKFGRCGRGDSCACQSCRPDRRSGSPHPAWWR